MNEWRAEEGENMRQLKEEMGAMKETLAVLKDGNPVLTTVQQLKLEVPFGGGMAELPIRTEAELEELIKKITENPSSHHDLVIKYDH